jgi:sugar-specific transcriptional regulator TrmB
MTDLDELGLSSYEETAYRALLVTGTATASELADASGVPKGRIYDVLNALERRQLVRTKATEPTRYVATDPETAVERLLAERFVELETEWRRCQEAANSARSNLQPTSPADASVWLGRLGGEEMETALREHTRTATESIHAVVGPPYESAPWETLEREVDAFFDGTPPDVSVSLLVSERLVETLPEAFLQSSERQRSTVDIRIRSKIPVSFDVIDRSAVSVDLPHPQSAADRIGVVAVTEDEVVAEFERQFQDLWRDAVPLPEL